MSEVLYDLVYFISEIHTYLLGLNDSCELYFTDKELHFLVIGILGMFMVFVCYPIFKYLAKHEHYLTLTWIYVFTLIIVITFAIEIGQKITHTGNMEFKDIIFGITGFLVIYAIYAFIVLTIKFIVKCIKKHLDKGKIIEEK